MIMIIAFLFKPIKKGDNQIKKQISCGDVFNISLVKNFKYLVWVSVIAFSLFGYFVPYVLMLKFVETNFDEGSDTRLPIMCIGLASGN